MPLQSLKKPLHACIAVLYGNPSTALSCIIHSLWCKFLLHACIRFSLIETMWLEKPSQRPSFAEIVTILKQGEKRMALVARNCILYLKIPFVFSVLDVMK